MASLRSATLRQEIVAVLQRAKTGKGREPAYLTAYQILSQLPRGTRQWLEATYCPGGRGGGKHYSAATHVARSTARLDEIQICWIDTTGLEFSLPRQKKDVEPSFQVCALFRLDPAESLWQSRPRRRRAPQP